MEIAVLGAGTTGRGIAQVSATTGHEGQLRDIEPGLVEEGLDVRLDALESLRAELGERFRPPQLLRRKVRAGKLGKRTGEIVDTSGDSGGDS